MVIGVLELELELALALLLLLLLLVLLLQAARTLTDSTAAPLRAKARLESQGRVGLTPGSSFLHVPSFGWMSALFGDVEPVGHFRVFADECQPRRLRLLLQERSEIGIAVSTSDQALDELMDDRSYRHRHLVFARCGKTKIEVLSQQRGSERGIEVQVQ